MNKHKIMKTALRNRTLIAKFFDGKPPYFREELESHKGASPINAAYQQDAERLERLVKAGGGRRVTEDQT